MNINRLTSMFKFSQMTFEDVDARGGAKFILANMGALRLKERSVIVGLVGELCKHIIRTQTFDGLPKPDFTQPSSYKYHSRHLRDSDRYTVEKLQQFADGLFDRDDPDFVSQCVALAELAERDAYRRDYYYSDESKEWRAKHGDDMTHDGFSVDLSYNQTIEFLTECRMHLVTYDSPYWHYRSVECRVLYDGLWWDLSRTDLKDNVATGRPSVSWNIDSCREFWKHQCRYGTRLNRWDDSRRSFSIIDAWSDG